MNFNYDLTFSAVQLGVDHLTSAVKLHKTQQHTQDPPPSIHRSRRASSKLITTQRESEKLLRSQPPTHKSSHASLDREHKTRRQTLTHGHGHDDPQAITKKQFLYY